MGLFLDGDLLEALVIAMLMNRNNGIHLLVGQPIDRGIHLGNRQMAKRVERAVVCWRLKRAFQGQPLDPDSFVELSEFHCRCSFLGLVQRTSKGIMLQENDLNILNMVSFLYVKRGKVSSYE